MGECPSCDNDDSYDDMVRCDVCKVYRHFSCARYTAEEISRIKSYVCESCEFKTGKLSIWKGKRAVGKVLEDKLKHYHDVEKILDHIEDSEGRVFQIKWKHCDEVTWEVEENLDGCLNLLQAYCRRNDIAASKIEGKLGALSDSDDTDEDSTRNFVTPSQIINIIQSCRSMGAYCTDLPIETKIKYDNKDKILIIGVKSHCYVMLYVAPDRGYIADGLNSYIEDLVRRSLVNREIKATKLTIKAIKFDQQVKVDHCGSSGALVALELMRAYRLGKLDTVKKLVAPISLRRRIRSALHRHESASVIDRTLTERREKWTCEICSKAFKTRKALQGHHLSHTSGNRK